MSLATFGFYKKSIHHKKFSDDWACGGVHPGDGFTEVMSRVTCERCINKLAPKPDEEAKVDAGEVKADASR